MTTPGSIASAASKFGITGKSETELISYALGFSNGVQITPDSTGDDKVVSMIKNVHHKWATGDVEGFLDCYSEHAKIIHDGVPSYLSIDGAMAGGHFQGKSGVAQWLKNLSANFDFIDVSFDAYASRHNGGSCQFLGSMIANRTGKHIKHVRSLHNIEFDDAGKVTFYHILERQDAGNSHMGTKAGVSLTRMAIKEGEKDNLLKHVDSITPEIIRLPGFKNLGTVFTSDTSCTVIAQYDTLELAEKANPTVQKIMGGMAEFLSAKPERHLLEGGFNCDKTFNGPAVCQHTTMKIKPDSKNSFEVAMTSSGVGTEFRALEGVIGVSWAWLDDENAEMFSFFTNKEVIEPSNAMMGKAFAGAGEFFAGEPAMNVYETGHVIVGSDGILTMGTIEFHNSADRDKWISESLKVTTWGWQGCFGATYYVPGTDNKAFFQGIHTNESFLQQHLINSSKPETMELLKLWKQFDGTYSGNYSEQAKAAFEMWNSMPNINMVPGECPHPKLLATRYEVAHKETSFGFTMKFTMVPGMLETWIEDVKAWPSLMKECSSCVKTGENEYTWACFTRSANWLAQNALVGAYMASKPNAFDVFEKMECTIFGQYTTDVKDACDMWDQHPKITMTYVDLCAGSDLRF